jgi:hypothetical protein
MMIKTLPTLEVTPYSVKMFTAVSLSLMSIGPKVRILMNLTDSTFRFALLQILNDAESRQPSLGGGLTWAKLLDFLVKMSEEVLKSEGRTDVELEVAAWVQSNLSENGFS